MRMRYIVWDTLCSEVIKEYKSRAWANKRRRKEIDSRRLLENGVVILELEELPGVVKGRVKTPA